MGVWLVGITLLLRGGGGGGYVQPAGVGLFSGAILNLLPGPSERLTDHITQASQNRLVLLIRIPFF